MDFELNADQEELRASVSGVLERECPIGAVRELVETGKRPDEPWRSATRLGWTGLSVPERFGGLGLGPIELGLVLEEHGRRLAPGALLPTLGQFVPILLEAASAEQQQRWLPSVAAGTLRGSLALAARRGSWHRPSDALLARPDGEDWKLLGERHYVVEGDEVDEIAVAARVASGDGVGLFVVPREAAAVERMESLDGSRSLAVLRLDGVPVPAERTLGQPGASAGALTRAIEHATVALSNEMVGTCAAIFDATLEYAKQREQFGRPIGSFQAIQAKLTDCFAALEKARAAGYYAAMTLAEDDPGRGLATSVAKAAAGACQRLLAQEGIQIHGGVGYTWEHDIQLFVKRAKVGDALFGTAAEHRARIADQLGV